ncbi:hypothetical protein GQ597_00385 [Gilliamella sp. Pra-s65]|uniref:hypothetical protein n=1 Tax=unclassified Gilliamella TaxID=2685620 RepID=UPI001365DEAC|nr:MULTISPECIES: hypothetical protein [unclassified Gilliamella]MWN89180.1 hypothetical protein [Gilliamella sp. Pra-s65]MWP72223.1 hypothetical protein [Gilliamella sp. Pra-s52]
MSSRSFRVAKSTPLSATLSPISKLLSKPPLLSKSALVFASLLLLPYTQGAQALSAQTSQVIHGSAPYLTFDGGLTKATNVDELLFITLPDGTKLTPSTNTSSGVNPIKLPNIRNTLGDIGMVVPPSKNSINLNDLIIPSNWGDDDGDGQGINGVTVTGSISVTFTDKEGNAVNRGDALDICNAPYKVTLSSTEGSLTTKYGVPKSSTFSEGKVNYYINPNLPLKVCHVRPNLTYGTGDYAGPFNIWSPTKGFLVQSVSSSSYDRNFPTTGADGLYFDLLIGGIDASLLTWSSVTHGGITATVTTMTPSDRWIPNIDRGKVVTRVTLSGPRASSSQIGSDSPSRLSKPILPQIFELVGIDSKGRVVKYGFELKQWFVNRGTRLADASNQSSWCSGLGYRFPQVRDLTNAVCSGKWSGSWCQGSVGAIPSSSGDHYQRRIGAGFFTEWGDMLHYANADFTDRNYWTSEAVGNLQFGVDSDDGDVLGDDSNISRYGLCTSP